ncbi:DUF3887 domain-containing protein [Synechococcus sp. PCC 7336]|uniref:DUF3887 domain-containing protein n=1 Tax=Synechococcus sp. PCC 7336 TaxID=195250 RepID=UPI00034A4369|nr:DUF3887 domain-containing protein [Synechococcus sp. PCC 7336]
MAQQKGFGVAIALAGFFAGAIAPLPVLAQESSATESSELSADIAVRAQVLEERAEEFIDALNQGNFARVRGFIAESLREQFTEATIEQEWQEILETAGPFARRGQSRYEWAVNTDFVAIELEFEHAAGDLLMVFDRQQQIVGLDFPPLRTQTAMEIAEQMVDALAASEFVEARRDLHPVLKGELLPEDLQEKWDRLQAIVGPFQQRLSSEVRQTSELDIVFVTLEFENVTENLLIFVNRERQIVGVDFPRQI